MKTLIFAALLFAYPLAQAQSAPAQPDCAGIDKLVSKHLQTLSDNGDNPETPAFADTLGQLVSELKRFATQHPDNWTCDFPESQKNHVFAVNTAADKRLRTYSWDLMNGGTMRFYFSLLQYRDAAGVTHIEENNADAEQDDTDDSGNGGFVTGILPATLGERGTAYWITEYFQGDGRNKGQSITLYHITDDGLATADWIATREGQVDHISFVYDQNSLQDFLDSGKHNPAINQQSLFAYDDDSKSLIFPVVIDNPEYLYGEITERTLRYQWDGNNFIYKP